MNTLTVTAINYKTFTFYEHLYLNFSMKYQIVGFITNHIWWQTINELIAVYFILLTSKSTLNTLSQSWSATSSLTVGGESRVSFIANRNRSSTSQVSFSNILESCAICWSVLNTLWQKTACLCIVSNSEKFN